MQSSDADFIAAIADDLSALDRRAREIGLISAHDSGPALIFRPSDADSWTVSLVTFPTVKVLSASGATPAAALVAFEAILDAHSPAIGWRTLGVECAA